MSSRKKAVNAVKVSEPAAPLKISIEWLVSQEICSRGLLEYLKLFGSGPVELTEANLKKASSTLNLRWLYDILKYSVDEKPRAAAAVTLNNFITELTSERAKLTEYLNSLGNGLNTLQLLTGKSRLTVANISSVADDLHEHWNEFSDPVYILESAEDSDYEPAENSVLYSYDSGDDADKASNEAMIPLIMQMAGLLTQADLDKDARDKASSLR